MFVPHVPGVDPELLPPRDELEHSLQFLFDVDIAEYLASVLGTPHNVVITDPGCMGLLIQASVHGQ